MTDRETMQQALECIERLNMRGRILADFEDEVYAAINALRKALAQPKQEPVAWMTEDECDVYTRKQVNGYFQHDHIPLYTTPPQLEQEPVPKPS